jgi:hypothetical protein
MIEATVIFSAIGISWSFVLVAIIIAIVVGLCAYQYFCEKTGNAPPIVNAAIRDAFEIDPSPQINKKDFSQAPPIKIDNLERKLKSTYPSTEPPNSPNAAFDTQDEPGTNQHQPTIIQTLQGEMLAV